MKFAHWCWRILKKGYWLLGLVPAMSGYLSTYFPANALSPLLSDILKAMANLQYTVIVVAACLLVSAYLVHSETEAVLAAYQYQEPKYRLDIKNVTSEVCRQGCHVHAKCNFSIKSLTPWFGNLTRITVEGENRISGLANWEYRGITSHGGHLILPFSIPLSECDYTVEVSSEIGELTSLTQREEWQNVVIPLRLLVEYFTQPVGDVSKLLPLNVQVNLEQEFDLIKAHKESSKEE